MSDRSAPRHQSDGAGMKNGRGTPWHTLTSSQTLAQLESRASGLTADEAKTRLALHGANRLERIEPVRAWRILADQFSSVVVLLLMGAATLALILGDSLEAAAIALVLVLNAGMGFAIELRARRTMDALLRYEVPTAKVVREGGLERISAEELVPGDVIELEEGDSVPADARLLTATELAVSEASLTGESIPVEKNPDPSPDVDTVLAERASMMYSATTVTKGRGTAVVVATGPESEIGRIGTLIAATSSGKTPLELRLDALGRRLVWLTLGVAGVVTALGIARGAPTGLMIETGIALAIAAVPEGLPAVATIALAVGLRRMAHRHAVVRRLTAVEALGATTVICTDKTGTLTAGQMTVEQVATVDRVLSVTGDGFSTSGEFIDDGKPVEPKKDPWLRELLDACALATRSSIDPRSDLPIGDPTDAALLVLALRGGVDLGRLKADHPLRSEVPFTSHRRESVSVHQAGDEVMVLIKGAPSNLLRRCTSWESKEGTLPFEEGDRALIAERNKTLASAGLRVIALAKSTDLDESELTFLGLVGIVDPPAPGVMETVRTFREAGIRLIMVTGDQGATARAIADKLSLGAPGEGSLGGRELAGLSDTDLEQRMRSVCVLSRVSPEDKVRVVSALQRQGEIVTMIGDGVNDAAALKTANAGVAMGGRGTDVAKETAAIVLQDDRFLTLGSAVEEGRMVFDNVRKFVFYLFSCNVAEVSVLFWAGVAGASTPLAPLQILWLNLVTDTFPALALAVEPAEPGLMQRPPRDPNEAILSARFIRAIGFYAALITGVTLGAYLWALSTGDPERATTVAFMTLALAQLFHLGNARARGPVTHRKRMFANPWAVASIPVVIALQLAAVYWPPLAEVLQTVPLSPLDWVVISALSLLPAVVGQRPQAQTPKV
jgi:P-type Ca2+ transporter type 2C